MLIVTSLFLWSTDVRSVIKKEGLVVSATRCVQHFMALLACCKRWRKTPRIALHALLWVPVWGSIWPQFWRPCTGLHFASESNPKFLCRCTEHFIGRDSVTLFAMLQLYRPSRSLGSAANEVLVVPSCRTTANGRLLSIFKFTLWKSLHINVRSAETIYIMIFKNYLKAYLFTQWLTNLCKCWLSLLYLYAFKLGFMVRWKEIV